LFDVVALFKCLLSCKTEDRVGANKDEITTNLYEVFNNDQKVLLMPFF